MSFAAWILLAALAEPPHEVAGVTIAPVTDPPRLVASYPAHDQAIAPGVLSLKLTFDQKMQEGAFDISAGPGAQAPDCLKTPRLLNDNRTFVLLCTTAPGQSYALALNARADAGFANIGDKPAEPTSLAFTTTKADPVRSLAAALKAEDLSPTLDIPIADAPEK